MQVFISSDRRGLEEERDALPGLITALGHTALAFEDFTTQSMPSRQACVDRVKAADAFVLLIGPTTATDLRTRALTSPGPRRSAKP